MNTETLTDAILEAKRFIKKATVALAAGRSNHYGFNGIPKESGSARRASMDLTRALAEMRKAG